ncbi:MAG TPA: type IV pilus assembly protein PilM, partial [Tepidisphaeraceae bacterium]|nr:type IV pilus assembly protein PilM [Tepidisphaeraceae bacterium]
MPSARSAWGIDIGNRALKAIKLVRDGDRFRVDDFEIIEHEQILSQAGDNKESLLQTALAHFMERHDTKGSVVGVSVSGQQSFARFIKLPPVEPKKIPEIVRFEAIQQIPFPLDDVEWSYQLFQEPDSPDVEVGIFAMKKDLVNRQIAYFTNLGLNVQVVQMNPLAVYNSMYYDDRVSQTTMFMDSGAENTDLIIAEGQSVWLRTLPIGGNNFTEALAKSFKLTFAKAEELKRNAATSKYAKQIFQAMRPVFADLVAETQRSIGFYASVHRDARIGRIVALGSTFQLPGLQKYLQQNLQLPVEKLDGFKANPPSDAKLAAPFQEGIITLAGAYGLALQAMGQSKISSSLLPQTIRRQKIWQEKTKWFATAAALFVLGALGAGASWYINDYVYEQAQPTRAEYQAKFALANRLSNQWKQDVEGMGKDDRDRLLAINSLQECRDLWPTLLHDVLAAVPTGTLDQLKKEKRENRRQIVVDSITSRYWPDVKAPLQAVGTDYVRYMGKEVSFTETPAQPQQFNEGYGGYGGYGGGYYGRRMLTEDGRYRGPGYGGGYGGGGYGAGGYGAGAYGGGGYAGPEESGFEGDMTLGPDGKLASNATRGFIVTIRGTTPNKGKSNFVDSAFVQKLLEYAAEQQLKLGKSWYVARAEIVQSGPRNIKNQPQADEFEENAELGGDIIQLDKAGKPIFDPKRDRVFPDEEIT